MEAATLQRKEFHADFPFTKSAEDEGTGELELIGYASTWVQDRDGDWMDPKAFDGSLPSFLKKNPILLWQHNMRQPFGKVASATVDSAGLKVRAVVPKPEAEEEGWKHTAYHDIRRGIVKTFSVGGFFSFDIENVEEDDEKWIIREVELLEISVVSIPSNPDSIFEAATKAIKGEGQPSRDRMADKAFGQMLQLLGIEEVTDPQLVTMDEDRRETRYSDLVQLFEHVNGREAPAYHAYRDLVGPLDREDVELADKLGVLPAVEQLINQLYAPPGDGAKADPISGLSLTPEQADAVIAAHRQLGEVVAQLTASQEA